jgi:hypothetical protein
MGCSLYVRLLLVIRITVSLLASAPGQSSTQDKPATTVTVRWGARSGVTRYRLQLAQDSGFTDIVFDRVVTCQEYRISGLAPGRYFWRVARMRAKLEFSSGGVIEVSNRAEEPGTLETARNQNLNPINADGGAPQWRRVPRRSPHRLPVCY